MINESRMGVDFDGVPTNKRHPLPDGPSAAATAVEPAAEPAQRVTEDALAQRIREFDHEKRYRVKFTVTTKDETAKPVPGYGGSLVQPNKNEHVYYPPLDKPGVTRLEAEKLLLEWYVRRYHNENEHMVVGPDLQRMPPLLGK